MEKTTPKGMDRALSSKISAKYDQNKATEVRNWIQEMLGIDIGIQTLQVEKNLKDGTVLLQLVGDVFKRCQNLPDDCHICDIKASHMKTPFKMMENIEKFLNAAVALGVQRDAAFNTGDLYDAKNMNMVVSTILQLGSEAQRYGMNGPSCGPAPTTSHRMNFSIETLRAGEGIIGAQAGTNKLASQQGMTMGKQRMVNDTKADLTMSKEGEAILSSQSGYNKGATQAGMRMGPRHIADLPIANLAKESEGFMTMQACYAEGASQKGMTFGTQRLINDPNKTGIQMAAESHAIVGLQSGSNQGANQSGMMYAAPRQIAGAGSGEDFQGKSTISTQYGFMGGATQSGMNMGKTRKITDQ